GNSELGLTSRIEELKSQLRNLEEEIGFLRARNAELAKKYEVKRVEDEERVKGLVDQVNGMKRELESSRRQKDGSEAKLEKKVEEVTETEMQLKSLKEETEEERNRLNEEIEYLKGENEKLHTRIAELDSLNM
ncbi:PREDICTED: testis-expressed sequence 9 protein-like, partial [Camelina sativa]